MINYNKASFFLGWVPDSFWTNWTKPEAEGGIAQDFVAQGYGILTLNPKKA